MKVTRKLKDFAKMCCACNTSPKLALRTSVMTSHVSCIHSSVQIEALKICNWLFAFIECRCQQVPWSLYSLVTLIWKDVYFLCNSAVIELNLCCLVCSQELLVCWMVCPHVMHTMQDNCLLHGMSIKLVSTIYTKIDLCYFQLFIAQCCNILKSFLNAT